MDNKNKDEEVEGKTKYGEFVSSCFGWVPVSKQKKRAEELNEMTRNDKNKPNCGHRK